MRCCIFYQWYQQIKKWGIILDANIIIEKIKLENCMPDLLSDFNRYQEVKRCWRKENGEWQLKDIAFVENWDDERKQNEVEDFIRCIESGGVVLGAYEDSTLIGFSSIKNHLFGRRGDYIRLEMLHVSFEFRNKGIGKQLFIQICESAKMLGAKKLYITAHSSEETQAFYNAVGCRETLELNQSFYEKEPFDCHIEYDLYRSL